MAWPWLISQFMFLHRSKNPLTGANKLFKQFKAHARLFVSATAISNHVRDIEGYLWLAWDPAWPFHYKAKADQYPVDAFYSRQTWDDLSLADPSDNITIPEERIISGSNLSDQACDDDQMARRQEYLRCIKEREMPLHLFNPHLFADFAAQNQCYLGRTGIPLAHFQQRWAQAPVHQASTPNDFTNLDPHNPFTGPADPNTAIGGSSVGPISGTGVTPVRNSFGTPTIRRFMQANAIMLANSCPGDWHIAPNRRLRGHLRAYAAGEERGIRREGHLVNVILYRLELAAFVDGVVDQFRLVRPFGQSLLYWDRLRWDCQHREDQKQRDIHKDLCEHQLLFHEDASGAQTWGFGRSHQYLAAAIFESNLDSQAVMQVAEEIGALFKEGARHAEERIVRHRSVRVKAAHWLGSMGRSIRSPSPVKGIRNEV